MKRKALGKGLRSLIPEAPSRTARTAQPSSGEMLQQIDLDKIVPNRSQPREQFDAEALEELARSLKKDGVLQPVLVRPSGPDEFELIAGERRWRAAQIAGLLRVPAIVRRVEDDRLLEVALIENLQREQLNAIEEANAFQTLVDRLGLTQAEVAQRVGKQRATVANALRLLGLPPQVQEHIREGRLSPGHAKALASLANSSLQRELADRIVEERLSVRQVETIVARMGQPQDGKPPASAAPRDPNVVAAEESLQTAVGTKVRILQRKSGAGRLELYFFSDEELERVYQLVLDAGRRSNSPA